MTNNPHLSESAPWLTLDTRARFVAAHRSALRAGFIHFAAGIRDAYPLVFNEPWPGETAAEQVAAYLRSKPEDTR